MLDIQAAPRFNLLGTHKFLAAIMIDGNRTAVVGLQGGFTAATVGVAAQLSFEKGKFEIQLWYQRGREIVAGFSMLLPLQSVTGFAVCFYTKEITFCPVGLQHAFCFRKQQHS